MRARIVWIDMARGWAIIAVIIGHIIISDNYWLHRWIYSFHMPLFIYLSGILFKTQKKLIFLQKKIKSIILPYSFFSICIILFQFISMRKILSPELSLDIVISFVLQCRQSVLWYMTMLFILEILFFIIVKLPNKYQIITIVFMVAIGKVYYMHGGQGIFWNVDVCCNAITFFYFGYMSKNKLQFLKKMDKNKKLKIACSFLSINIIFCFLTWIVAGAGIEMYNCSFGFIPFSYLSAIAGIIFMVFLVNLMPEIRVVKYIGENSLTYYAVYAQIAMSLVYTIYSKIGIFQDMVGIWIWGHLLVSFILILFFCTIINICIKKTSLRIVLGGR